MRDTIYRAVAAACLVCSLQAAHGAAISLAEFSINVDGLLYESFFGDPMPAEVDLGGFDAVTGLGSIEATFNTAGTHYFGVFFDHDILGISGSLYDEYGCLAGLTASGSGQTWEIDEPGYVYGDIHANLAAGLLDNSIGTPVGSPFDTAMAMGWHFSLQGYQSATVSLFLSQTPPTADFVLCQSDADGVERVYLWGGVDITGEPVPDCGATVLLLGIALLTLARVRCLQNQA